MEISSRMPDGWPNECPICGHSITITPSPDTLDAPCPHCGHLLWFSDTAEIMPLWQSSSVGEETVPYELPHDIEIDAHIVELIPRSLARENLLLPLADSSDALLIAVAVPVDRETIDKLQFILNRRVLAVPTSSNWIERQLNRYYRTDDAADAG